MEQIEIRHFLAAAGALFLNILLAVLGTAIIESPFERYTVVVSGRQSFFNMDLMTSVFAFGLGFSIYHLTPMVTAKWVWIIGLFWYAQKALLDPNHILLWEVSATRSAMLDFQAMANWSIYTLPGLRMLFYSAGALCCSLTTRRKHRKDGQKP